MGGHTENSEPSTERMTMAKHDITVLGFVSRSLGRERATDQLQALKADTMGFIVDVTEVGKLGEVEGARGFGAMGPVLAAW
jgi:hypothetical protein